MTQKNRRKTIGRHRESGLAVWIWAIEEWRDPKKEIEDAGYGLPFSLRDAQPVCVSVKYSTEAGQDVVVDINDGMTAIVYCPDAVTLVLDDPIKIEPE